MDAKKQLEFLEGYAKWKEQVKNEIEDLILNGFLGNPEAKKVSDFDYTEDGKISEKHFTTIAGTKHISDIQKSTYKSKVTSWKDSKFYVEI